MVLEIHCRFNLFLQDISDKMSIDLFGEFIAFLAEDLLLLLELFESISLELVCLLFFWRKVLLVRFGAHTLIAVSKAIALSRLLDDLINSWLRVG